MLRAVFALYIVLFAVFVNAAQVYDEEYKISPHDKAELQRLAKRFEARMQQTRDIGPLILEFFFEDIGLFVEALYNSSPGDAPPWSREQSLRVFVGRSNWNYLTALSSMTYPPGRSSTSLFEDLGIGYVHFPDREMTVADPNGALFEAKLATWEKLFLAAKATLGKRNLEKSAAYQKRWKENRHLDRYNYDVSLEIKWGSAYFDGAVPPAIEGLFPGGVRVFEVTTPSGLSPSFIKQHGCFWILWLGVFPSNFTVD